MIVVLVGVGLSVLAGAMVRDQALEQAEIAFDQLAGAYTGIIQNALEDTEGHLASVYDLFATSGDVSLQQFRDFTQSSLSRHPGIWAFSWLPRVPGAERDAFERGAREHVDAQFQIKELNEDDEMIPSPDRDAHFPILYYEPVDPSERGTAFGFDPMSNPARRMAFEAARDTGKASGTSRIQLFTIAENQFAIAIVRAIYQGGEAIDTIEERRAALKGYITGVLRVDVLTETSLRDHASAGLDIYLYDLTEPSRPEFLYFHPSRSRVAGVVPEEQQNLRFGMFLARPLNVAGRNWSVLFKPAPGFFVAGSWQAIAALLGGLLLTGILALYQSSVLMRNAHISEQVRKRTDELSEAQQRIAGILDTAHDGIISVGSDQRIIMFNQGAQQIFGYTEAEALGQTLEMLIPGRFRDNHPKLVKAFRKAPQSSIPMSQRSELPGLRKDGSEFPAEASVSKLSHRGEWIYTATIRDISERVQIEQERKQALVRAEEASRAKSEFLANMSHELRTPLNAILGFSEIISQRHLGPSGAKKYEEYAGDIHGSASHLLSLVNDLLDISAIEAGERTLTKEKLAIPDIIKDCVKFVSSRASEAEISLEAKVPTDLPPIYADKRAIKQILINLLQNAVKFTAPRGNVSLTASTSATGIALDISDTGRGIPAAALEALTKPFNRSDVDPHKATDGWGLGLAITNSLIELHGGELSVESVVGKGTTFRVTLPLGETKLSDEASKPTGAANYN